MKNKEIDIIKMKLKNAKDKLKEKLIVIAVFAILAFFIPIGLEFKGLALIFMVVCVFQASKYNDTKKYNISFCKDFF